MTWLVPFFGSIAALLVQALLLAVVVTLLQLLLPVFTQMVVDTVIVENDAGLLQIILIAMGVTLVFMQLATWPRNTCSASRPCASTPRSWTS